jgi:8-oxo-dGTP pyrophosphatase MutT (NUDIX family)
MQKSSTIAVISNNQILVLRRGKTAPWMPGKYCLPGGKLESNESLIECAARELLEETSINCSIENIDSYEVHYRNGYSKTVFITKIHNPIVILNWEHDGYEWIDNLTYSNYLLVPGLQTTIKKIYSEILSSFTK